MQVIILWLLDPWRWDWQVDPKHQYHTTILRFVKSQNTTDLT